MAKASENKYGGWEEKTCVVCGAKCLLTHSTATWCNSTLYGPFSVCKDCTLTEGYAAAKARHRHNLEVVSEP